MATPPPQNAPLDFPLRGLSTAYTTALQPGLTTPVATNVRSQDFFERRVRGGSRSGLSRYVDARVNGVNPVQCLDVVVTFHFDASLYEFDQSSEGPGSRIADPATNNYPDGPGPSGLPPGTPTGPGGGPNAPTSPPFVPNFNRRHKDTATVPQGGNGIMQIRTTSVVPPSPPPPPGMVTRTYTPYVVNHDPELFGVFSLGPVTLPLTPPTDLSLIATPIDYFGNSFNPDGSYTAWGGVDLPTVAQVNAMMTSWLSSPAPYESSVDT